MVRDRQITSTGVTLPIGDVTCGQRCTLAVCKGMSPISSACISVSYFLYVSVSVNGFILFPFSTISVSVSINGNYTVICVSDFFSFAFQFPLTDLFYFRFLQFQVPFPLRKITVPISYNLCHVTGR